MKDLIKSLGLLKSLVATRQADGPEDNIPSAVRQIPLPGIEVRAADRE